MTLIKSAVINLSDGGTGQCEAAATNSFYPGPGAMRAGADGLNFTVLATCNLCMDMILMLDVYLFRIRQIKYLSYKLNAKVELLLVKMMQKLRNGMSPILPLVYLSQ